MPGSNTSKNTGLSNLAKISLATEICGVRMRNPTILASGILGVSGDMLIRAAHGGAGAVTSKSCSLEPRVGHPNPTVIESEGLMMNAIGLSNPGVDEEIRELRRAIKDAGVPVIASVFADRLEEFAAVTSRSSEAWPHLIELNISCPNVESKIGMPFSCSFETAAKATQLARSSTKLPLIVKLSPNVPDIVSIARAVEDAGADAICAINTVGPGMAIDIQARRPILSNKTGGISGKLIRPIALRCVYQISRAVKIPVIGTGGIENGKDALEMLMCGARAVGVGTAVYSQGPEVFSKINQELENLMKKQGYSKISEIKLVD
ncbi:MAG: dihydroorotate dehydrogenase [Candidatus Micrarchaeota archaeon]|nr:dihydroorotate dehydrogenase [Candidatus Micrarchaeota archaeon]